MQKWIYSRSPKKRLFEKRRLPSFNEIPKYSRTFSLKPNKKENKELNGVLIVLIVVGLLFVVFSSLTSFKHYSNHHTKQVAQYKNYRNTKAFEFLMDSGKSRLHQGRILDAYSEFKLAHKIHPKDKELNEILTETLSILCDRNSQFCKELDDLL
ncbi:hypothetical protein [Flavisericum labens]|uniref:hypothetical protein n=1 Tax=Flavisericum labens TaxID=3377112 RepID=UPI00387B03AA